MALIFSHSTGIPLKPDGHGHQTGGEYGVIAP